jgi:site-specific DNA-methyltransferase (adenine-specific)/modification methylase
MEREQIGACTLLRGDCLEVLPTLEAHAMVSDPPYGIRLDWTKDRRRISTLAWSQKHPSACPDPWTHAMTGDTHPFDPRPWLHIPQIILWGGHLFAGLPPARGWLVWDKRCGSTPDSSGDAELAWTNLDTVVRIHRQLWRGVIRAGEENAVRGMKLHPCQKPIALMRWCIRMTTGLVLDPYMGSGTTGLACVELGRPFLGVEIEPRYFDIACQRITDAYAQPDLFVPTPTRPEQQALFTGGR